jgi:adenosine kinase
MNTTSLVICGSVAIDRIMNFSGQYRDLIDASKIDVLSVSVLVDSLVVAEGGTAGNITYNLACLGERPILLSSVGSDAKAYIERLKSIGVDTKNVQVSSQPTASFNVLTDTTGNQVGGFYPGAMTDAKSLSFKDFKDQDVVACVSAHDPAAMLRQTKECAKYKIPLVYDPGQQVSNISGEDIRTGVESAKIVIVNEYELELMLKKTGWSIDQLKSKVPILISTHGAKGSNIMSSYLTQPLDIKSVKPRKIVDPTGAGDAYRAGFLYGYLRQWELAACGQLGSVLASFVLEHHGPQTKLTKDSVVRRYKESFNERIKL